MANTTLLQSIRRRLALKYPGSRLYEGFERDVANGLYRSARGRVITTDHIDMAILQGMKELMDGFEDRKNS